MSLVWSAFEKNVLLYWRIRLTALTHFRLTALTYHQCLFVSYLTSVAFGCGWISDTKFQKFLDKDWIEIFKKFIGYGSGVKKSISTHLWWAWTGSALVILRDTCEFFWSGLDLDNHFWKKFGSGYWFDFYNEIFLRSASRCHKWWWQCFLCYGFYIDSVCCTHHNQW